MASIISDLAFVFRHGCMNQDAGCIRYRIEGTGYTLRLARSRFSLLTKEFKGRMLVSEGFN